MRKFDLGAIFAKMRRQLDEEGTTPTHNERIIRAFLDSPPQWEFREPPPRPDPTLAAVEASRLYGALRAQAEADVTDMELMKIGGNKFRILKYRYERDGEKMRQLCRVSFRLNGKTYTVEAYTDIEGMRREIIQRIAEILVTEITSTLMGAGHAG
jgi:uncharacterized protein YkuJ